MTTNTKMAHTERTRHKHHCPCRLGSLTKRCSLLKKTSKVCIILGVVQFPMHSTASGLHGGEVVRFPVNLPLSRPSPILCPSSTRRALASVVETPRGTSGIPRRLAAQERHSGRAIWWPTVASADMLPDRKLRQRVYWLTFS